MNITTKAVLQHFLSELKAKLEKQNVTEIDPFFEDFLLKEELIDIVSWMYPKDVKDIPIEDMKKYELLDMIGGDYFILDYFFEKWNSELQEKQAVSDKQVWKTLEQLSQQTHYLGSKPIASWDEYDHSNYRAMQYKAGKITRVYGIYDILVTQDEVYNVDSSPNRFYETKQKAESAMEYFIRDKKLQADEVHILSRYTGK